MDQVVFKIQLSTDFLFLIGIRPSKEHDAKIEV